MAESKGENVHENIADLDSDCVYDFYCEYCKDDGLNTEAVGYCVECNVYLCQGCINAHKRSRPLRCHDILDQNKMPREAPLSQDRVNREIFTKCKVHSNKSVEYYCVSHQELVCSDCFVKVHRHCKEIQSIHEESESIIGSSEYNYFTDGLKDMNKKASNIISKAHDNKAALDHFTTKATEQLKSFRAEVNAIFDEMEKSLLTEIRSILSEDNDAMDKMTEHLTKISDRAKAILAETEKLADSKLVCQLFIQIKEKQNSLVSLNEKIRQAEERNKVRMIEFEANNDIRTAFKATGLGKIKVQRRCAKSNDRSPATPTKKYGDHKPTKGPDVSSYSSYKKVTGMWEASGLQWTDFVPKNRVDQFLKDMNLEFTKGGDSVPTTPTTGLPVKDIADRLHLLIVMQGVMQGVDNEKVFDWIESNVDEPTTKQSKFIRALMTAVCNSAIKGRKGNERVDPKEIRDRHDLLQKYLNHQPDLELQALYALQALVTKLEHPPGVLRHMFDTFYDEDIISEDAFIQWEKSKDEPDGKGAALKQVIQFFTWLRDAEDDS